MEPQDILTRSRDTALHRDLPWLVQGLEWVAAAVVLAAIGLMLLGAGRFVLGWLQAELHPDDGKRVHRLNRRRIQLGRYILGGLELLIVSDIIHTALTQSLVDLLFLGALVLIRAGIGYFLDREIRDIREEAET